MRLVGLSIIAILLGLVVWFVPSWQAISYRERINQEAIAKLEPGDRVQLDKDLIAEENRARLNLAQIIGGLVLLSGLYLTWRNIKVNEEGKLTDRFSKAVELLGSKHLDGRIGGVYALERIAKDSRKDHWTVMEVLTAFVREQSWGPSEKPTPAKVKPDIQAALSVIIRRRWHRIETKDQRIDLSGAYLPQANLKNARLKNISLNGANLNGANFSGSTFSNVDFADAYLDEADLRSSNLTEDDIIKAHCSGAQVDPASLKHAIVQRSPKVYSPELKHERDNTIEREIETPVGAFICYKNGTFLDVTNNLMWVQALFGMVYDGKRFKGKPIELSWTEATRLFGCGGKIFKMAGLEMTDIKEENKFVPGRCSVHFAGYEDWHLPTARELLTLSFCNSDWPRADNTYDGYHYSDDVKSRELRKQLFIGCAYLHKAWSANENGGYGWAFDGQDNLGDYEKSEAKPVLFVRTISGPPN